VPPELTGLIDSLYSVNFVFDEGDGGQICMRFFSNETLCGRGSCKVKQSRYRPEVAQRVPGSSGSQIT
jgi:hypothetical protein